MHTTTTPIALAVRVAAATALLGRAAAVVFVAKIGPVVATISADHGIHLGDAIAVIPTVAAALLMAPARPRSGSAST